jgi:ribonuclease P protein component
MLSKNQRLKTKDVKLISQKGQKIETSYFNIKYLVNSDHKTSKFAVNVSKKIHKRAVVRNKIKRRIKAAIINIQNQKSKHASFVINVRSLELFSVDFNQLKNELKHALTIIIN